MGLASQVICAADARRSGALGRPNRGSAVKGTRSPLVGNQCPRAAK